MDVRKRIGSDNQNIKLIQSYKEQEAVQDYDRQRSEEIRLLDEQEKGEYDMRTFLF